MKKRKSKNGKECKLSARRGTFQSRAGRIIESIIYSRSSRYSRSSVYRFELKALAARTVVKIKTPYRCKEARATAHIYVGELDSGVAFHSARQS